MRRFLISFAVLLYAAFCATAEVSFGSLSVNDADEVLFTVSQSVPGTVAYSTLFSAKLGTDGVVGKPGILTCFPEKMEMVQGGAVLQVRNRYGSAWYSVSQKTLTWLGQADRLPVEYSRTPVVSVSPDGTYECLIDEADSGRGRLILRNVRTQEQVTVADFVPFSLESAGVKWSPDSAVLVYEKDGSLFFISPSSAFSSVRLSESFRRIGEGSIASVAWTSEKSLLYIDGDIVYRILQSELYTRGLYASLAGTGTIVGRLPYPFDVQHDMFWSDASGGRIVVVSHGNLVSVYSLASRSYDFVQSDGVYTLSGTRGAVLSCDVFWSESQKPYLWVNQLLYEDGTRSSALYKLSPSFESVFEVKNPVAPSVSPNGTQIAFASGSTVYVYDLNASEVRLRLRGDTAVSFAWGNSTTLYVGGESTVRSLNTRTGEASVVFLSSVDKAAWNGGMVYAQSGGSFYSYNSRLGTWSPSSLRNVQLSLSEGNARFRVFTGTAQNKRFLNAVYVRSLSGPATTYPLFAQCDETVPPLKRVALVFDAVDRADGLAQVLSALAEFDVPATFFINGEFVRRYPSETRQIVASGHECASGFFSMTDLTDSGFLIDAEFVRRGLARNEDEFYSVTGKELALLWHAPGYRVTPEILAAGEAAGYRYVDAVVPAETSVSQVSQIVSRAYDGMVIPVSVSDGTANLPLLVSALLDSGCTVVDVRNLID